MAARRGTDTRKPAARKSPRRKPASGKTGRKKTTRKNITPRKTAPRVSARGKDTRKETASPKKITSLKKITAPKKPISRPRLATANWPAKVLRWTPAKAVVTFPYRAYCWASDVAEDYRSFAASLDQ